MEKKCYEISIYEIDNDVVESKDCDTLTISTTSDRIIILSHSILNDLVLGTHKSYRVVVTDLDVLFDVDSDDNGVVFNFVKNYEGPENAKR